jgi:2-dehydropantoate 2-reductase
LRLARTSQPQLCFLCFGTGAIGTYVGGSLALSGQKVLFLERPSVAAEIREKGLCLKLNGNEAGITSPDVVTSIEEALTRCPFDMAILAVKSYDTRPLLDELAGYSVALPPFLCLQNGVENESYLAQVLGPERVIAGSVTSAISKLDSGRIVLERLRGIGLASDHHLVPTLVSVFNNAGLNARQYGNPAAMKWSKMITNLISNASSAILDMTPGEVISHPGLFRLEIRQLREALNVMAAQGIPVVNLPGVPVLLLSWAIEYLPQMVSQPLLRRSIGAGRGNKMPSFHIDLYNGKTKSEVDYLNGAVVRFGEKYSIPTPVNRFLNETLLGIVEGKIDKKIYAHDPKKLLSAAPIK